MNKPISLRIGLALVATLALGAPAHAQDGPFAGQTFRIIVPHAAGGGLDGYARMIAPYIEKYSGARVALENMPGAGGVVGNNAMWGSTPDGLTMSFTGMASVVLADLSGNEGAQTIAPEATWLGRSSAQPRLLLVGPHTGLTEVAQLRDMGRPFIYPAQGPDEDFYAINLFTDAAGIPLTIVSGYEGVGDSNLSVFSGDTDGTLTAASTAAPAIAAGDFIPLMAFTSERHPLFPDLPTPREFVGADVPELNAIVSVLEMDRGFIGPAGIDDETKAALRELMAQVHADPELVARAAEVGMPIIFLHGDEVEAKVQSIFEAADTLIPALAAAVERLQ